MRTALSGVQPPEQSWPWRSRGVALGERGRPNNIGIPARAITILLNAFDEQRAGNTEGACPCVSVKGFVAVGLRIAVTQHYPFTGGWRSISTGDQNGKT